MHAIFRALFAIAVALVTRSVAFATLSFLVMCIVTFGMGGFFVISHVYPLAHGFSFVCLDLTCSLRALACSLFACLFAVQNLKKKLTLPA